MNEPCVSALSAPDRLTAERPLARFGDLQPCDFNRLRAADHTLDGRGGESNGAALLKPPHSLPPSDKFLHHDPVALDIIQIKLDRCGCLGRRHIGRLDLAEDFALGAQQDDAPAALDAAGELGGAVFAGSAGHSGKYSPCPAPDRVRQDGPMADHTIDRWDDATGESI